ncbi:MAG: hypothetical protein LAP86_27530 [Acidobacteriia bacterium]|nr:hypothetical protein [Terriglobia bacterium]
MFLSVVVVILLLIVLYRFALKGKIGNFSGGIGNALFQVHTFLRPTTQNIVEAKKQRQQDAKQGDDDKPPELPPWAQSGN